MALLTVNQSRFYNTSSGGDGNGGGGGGGGSSGKSLVFPGTSFGSRWENLRKTERLFSNHPVPNLTTPPRFNAMCHSHFKPLSHFEQKHPETVRGWGFEEQGQTGLCNSHITQVVLKSLWSRDLYNANNQKFYSPYQKSKRWKGYLKDFRKLSFSKTWTVTTLKKPWVINMYE